MNHDEFAFFSRQLGSMLRDGIPLESGLRELCQGLSSPAARREVEALERDLASGTPLDEAMRKRDLPDLFKRMVVLGARGNNLPGVLTLLADHYSRVHLAWTRLKGLMVYPGIVLVASLGLSVLLVVLFKRVVNEFKIQNVFWSWRPPDPPHIEPFVGLLFWVPLVVLVLLTTAFFLVVLVPALRNYLRWKLPPFREASIAQTASALAMILRSGTPLPEALVLAGGLEAGTPAGTEIARWGRHVAAGQGKPEHWANRKGPFPPLFYWLVRQGGEDLAAGFDKAAEIYHSRASYRIEMLLYGFLPVSVLLLGQVILWQVLPLVYQMNTIWRMFGAEGMD